MTAPIDKVLPHLQRVRRTGPGRWSACCPAHDDRSPSLAVRLLDDDRVLLHCFGGCGVHDVLAAIGLDVTELFPPKIGQPGAGYKAERRPFSALDLIDLAAAEAGIAVVITADMLNGKPDADRDRLVVAAGRLADVYEAIHADR